MHDILSRLRRRRPGPPAAAVEEVHTYTEGEVLLHCIHPSILRIPSLGDF